MASLLASTSHGNKLGLFFNLSFILLLSFYLTNNLHQSKKKSTLHQILSASNNDETCTHIERFHDQKSKCDYVRSNIGCRSTGYIDYLQLFYCVCAGNPIIGYTLLLLWLVVLFYLLGNTAANYFCSSLESLSRVLKLSPTIAGVTLLSLGNGAPDVFASIVSFMGDGTSQVGFSSILGGAFFVSSIVVGIISISISQRQITVDKSSFLRDVVFFLLSLCALLAVVMVGRIDIWGAMSFVSLYFIYVFIVSASHLCKNKERVMDIFDLSPKLPITRSFTVEELATPLLSYIGDEKVVSDGKVGDQKKEETRRRCCDYFGKLVYILELPIYLPRRLTIPVVSEERWSKTFAVASVTFAPVLLSVLCNSERGNMGSKASILIYLIAGFVGIILGTVAFVTTKKSSPPRRCLLPWLIGGFLMSVTWSYIIAQELVALLVSLGIVFGISPSVLGLTLLAWGNSLGDLIANVAMAMNGGSAGIQIAISGCFAGPIFNTLVGLGLPLVFSSWSEYPSSYVIPKDPFLYETLGFIMGGLLWSLIILPRKDMKPDRVLGGGLLAIYLCFLSVRLCQALGVVVSPAESPEAYLKP